MTVPRIEATACRDGTDTGLDRDLIARLDAPLPKLTPGSTSEVFVCGSCFHRRLRVRSLELIVDGARHRPLATRMPRLDIALSHPEARCYRSGFWALVPIPVCERPAPIEVAVEARLADGRRARAEVGRVEIEPAAKPPDAAPATPLSGAEIAICMATYDPDIELLRIQIDSIRGQTDERWICLISDDCSPPESFAEIRSVVGDDPRFIVSRSPTRIGFYRNFERALRMVPAGIELVALSDQDDRWYADKLATLRAAIGDSTLVYSDMRLVDRAGRSLRESLWEGRTNNHTNLASLLIANTVSGAASLLRRETVELALPFPAGTGWELHDHWLGLVALASGPVAYVDRPLYDYVQHSNAILGQVAVDDGRSGPRWSRAIAGFRVRAVLARWRAAYFHSYLQARLQGELLLARCDPLLTPGKRRALRWFGATERSPLAFARLAVRPLRRVIGRDETLGTEFLFLRAIAWRWVVAVLGRGGSLARRLRVDASMRPFDLDTVHQRRIRRWRARR